MKKTLHIFFIILIPFIVGGCRSITGAAPEFDMGKSQVILSFDDGPNSDGDTTARLLDVLKKYNIHAMFALLGENVEQNTVLARRIHEEGHVIINHGYSDQWAVNMKDEEFRDNLSKGDAAIAAILDRDTALGVTPYPRLYRPHGGFYHQRHEKIWREEGWAMVSGNIRAYDAAKSETGKKKVIRQIIKKTEKNDGGIILLHDGKNSFLRMEAKLAKNPTGSYNRLWIPGAVEEIIIALLARGFQIQ